MKRLTASFRIKNYITKLDKFKNKDKNTDVLVNVTQNILKHKMTKIAIDTWEYAILDDVGKAIYEYQNQPFAEREKLTKEELQIDSIKTILPDAIYNGVAYRALLMDKDHINIYTGEVESWSKDKSFVDNAFHSLFLDDAHGKNCIVKLKAQIYGIDITEFWIGFKAKIAETFKEEFGQIDTLFLNEAEIVAETPSNYEIYEIEEV